MAERLALLENVDHLTLVEQLDGATPHDVEVLRGWALLGKDLGSAREVLDLRTLAESGERVRAQRSERRIALQEAGELTERLVQRRHAGNDRALTSWPQVDRRLTPS